MKKYEQMFILATDTEGDRENELVEKLKSVITDGGGDIIESTRWGKRRLAYEIRKQFDGIYWFHVFNAPPEVPAKLRRIIRITEGFIRDMLIDLTYSDKAEVRREKYLKGSEKRRADALSKKVESEATEETDEKEVSKTETTEHVEETPTPEPEKPEVEIDNNTAEPTGEGNDAE